MHGLINRSIQCFVSDSYGASAWQDVVRTSGIGYETFEALLTYDSGVTEAVLMATTAHLSVSREMLLEDIGTYLVSAERMAPLRRLLRIGGETFVEFLYSLDELQDRAHLAVDDLDFPVLELRDHQLQTFTLQVEHDHPGFGHVFVGVLRAMADEYGALAFLEHRGRKDGVETISIELVMTDFAEGRAFALAAD